MLFENEAEKQTDYQQSNNWLAWPEEALEPVDVFYLYPTAWEAKNGRNPLCSAAYKPLRNKARFLLNYQATAFSAEANLYAPYYRQYDAGYLLALDFAPRFKLVCEQPGRDTRAAFEFYLEHSENRPLILAGHSQGAMLIKDLLYTVVKKRPEVKKRLVAAYILGSPVTGEDLAAHPEFPFAQGADDTGVIISYNTEAPGAADNPVVAPGSVAINPISWTRGPALAEAQEGAGSYLVDRCARLQNLTGLADARLDLNRGTVICSTFNQETFYGPGVQMINPFPYGVLHIFDIALYYHDLRKNAVLRGRQFRRQKASPFEKVM